jgi:uncharacterized Zn-binding protein involved in type VI secretion
MSKLAARIGDMHACPVDTSGVPHVGGPILAPGAPNVLIGGKPAARAGDMALCVGPLAEILVGSPTVLIGGKPAARQGDATAHGGLIIAGSLNVLIS